MASPQMQSPFGHAAGLGSAKEGINHWWRQRVTAVALIPLILWLLVSLILRSGDDYAAFVAWLKMPIATCMMILSLVAIFYHTALGLQVIIEDYVHSAMKIPALILMRLAYFGLATAGILAVLRIVFG